MDMKIEQITPELAKKYLSMSAGNRQIRKSRIDRYCRDRLSGNWHLTHQGIAFDTQGKLRDGHHRLHMVVLTGLPTPFAVFRNVREDGLALIDAGLSRSPSDALSMGDKGKYSFEYLSLARNFKAFPKHKAFDLTPDELLVEIAQYKPAFDFAMQCLPGKISGVSRATRCLIARAYYHADRVRVHEFCRILATGMPENPKEDAAAIVLRNYLLATASQSGPHLELERYWKGQSALSYFVRRETITRVYGTDDDLYPIPSV